MNNISYDKITDKKTIIDFENEWRKLLTFPNDDYWEYQLEVAQYWLFKEGDQKIGYACISQNGTLLQYFITAKHLHKAGNIFKDFIKQNEIKKARMGSNNPVCMAILLHFQKSVVIDGYLFSDMVDVPIKETAGTFKMAKEKDLDSLVDFSHRILDAPKDWLTNYISNWISREEFFFLERNGKIIGTSEVRTTDTNTKVASLGIVVCSENRNQGIGTYLLGQGKAIAKSRNHQVICGCSKENIASLKAIEKSGFRILHSFSSIDF